MVADGYYVMLNPLPVGTHTIEFGGALDATELLGFTFELHIKYEVTVAGGAVTARPAGDAPRPAPPSGGAGRDFAWPPAGAGSKVPDSRPFTIVRRRRRARRGRPMSDPRARRPRPVRPPDVTRLLDAAAAGDRQAAADLLPLVYDELRKLAAARLAAEAPGPHPRATALVHEAYLRLVGRDAPRLDRPRALLRGRRRGHAPHPGRGRPAQAGRRSAAAAGHRVDAGRPAAGRPRRPTTTCSPWTRP